MSYYRRGYSWENIQYLIAPTGGWNPDGNPWELPESHAVVLDNALVRPGRVAVRGSLTNWADLSAITSPGPPLNVCGVQPIPGNPNLAIGRKAISATAFVDPWFAPMIRPTTSAALAAPTADLAVALGGAAFTNTATAANLIPGPRGISFEGTRYYIGYGTLTAPVTDAGGAFFAQSTNLCTINTAGTVAAMTNAPRGFIDIKGYQSRIWGLGGIDDPGGGTTFNALSLFFTNPIGPGGGNAGAFADWKDPVSGLTNKILMDGDTTDPGVGLATVRGGLLIFRQDSIWILRGSTTANYTLSPVSRQVGCIDPRSIVETDKGIYFVSSQGLMVTDGVTVRNVSGGTLHTIQSAIQIITGAIVSSFGGYATCTVTSGGQLLVSLGISSVTAAAPDGHIQPVWCGMFDPDAGSWTRLTSALFAADGMIVVPGNNYPGWVFATPDERLLSIGDKYITQWEAAASTSVVTTLSATDPPTAVTSDAAVGSLAWSNPANAKAVDGAFASSGPSTFSGAPHSGGNTAPTQTGAGTAWTGLVAPTNNTWTGFPVSAPTIALSGAGVSSQQLLFTAQGFSVPSTAKVVAMAIQFRGNQFGGSGVAECQGVQWVKGGAAVGNNFGNTSPLQNNPTYTEFMDTSTGLINGTAWTPADINSANFGVALTVVAFGGNVSSAALSGIIFQVFYTDGYELLKTTAYGFAVPSNATITGIQPIVTRNSAGGQVIDDAIQLYKAGTLQATNRSARAVWGTSTSSQSYGGASDLWGTTWTPSDVNNAGFGVAVAPLNTANNAGIRNDTANVDAVTLTVYYTVASITHQQSFVRSPALYDLDAAGAYQPIPFRWLTRWFPVVGTTTLTRKFGQMKRWFCDYVFQGIGLPSANGFTAKPVDASSILIPGAAPVQLLPTDNSMTSSSVSGGQPNATTSIERSNADLPSEISDLAFDISFIDTAQVTQPSSVAAELYGVGIEYQPGRDLK